MCDGSDEPEVFLARVRFALIRARIPPIDADVMVERVQLFRCNEKDLRRLSLARVEEIFQIPVAFPEVGLQVIHAMDEEFPSHWCSIL